MNISKILFNLNSSEEKTMILKEGSWVAIGQIATAAGALVGIRLLTQYISPEVFGSFNLLMGISALGYSLFCFPLLQAILRLFSEEIRKDRQYVFRNTITRIMKRRTLLLTVIILSAGAVYSAVSSTPFWAVIALTGILVVDIIRGTETAFLAASRRHKRYSLWNIADAWLKPMSIIVVAALIGTSLPSVLFGYAAAAIVVLAFIYVSMRREYVNFQGEAQELNSALEEDIHKFAFPLISLAIVGWVSGLSDRYIIGGLLGLEKVGIYAASYGLISRPFIMAGAIIEQTVRPVYFNAISAGNNALGKNTLYVWAGTSAVVCMTGLTAVILLREKIAFLMLAEKYRSGAELMPWIALGYSFMVVGNVFEKPSYAAKKTRTVLLIQVCGAVASICIAIPMIYHSGLRGAAFAVPLYFGVQLVVSIIIAQRIMGGH
jgi:O-antigen/teichoic acid export membrane protein